MRIKRPQITAFVLLILVTLSIVIFATGCNKENSDKTSSPTLSDTRPAAVTDKNEGNREDGKYSITYSGLTEYLITGPSEAKKNEVISLRAKIPMEGLLVVYLNGSELKPSGTDENDRIIYGFTMPDEDVTIEFRITI